MTPDEINAAIAESLGARIVRKNFDHYKHSIGERWEWMDGTPCGHPGGGLFGHGWNLKASAIELPSYHGSLDAIVPVVRAMMDEQMQKVIANLAIITLHDGYFAEYVATPAQWCEAYLKAKGLWES